MNEEEMWFWLTNANGIGNKRIKSLLDSFKDIERIYNATGESLQKVQGISKKNVKDLFAEKEIYKKKYERLHKLGISFIYKSSRGYPEKLTVLPDAPYAVYVWGSLPEKEQKSIAIIGARDCSGYGRELAMHFAKNLTEAGIQVISGMARGIDGYAHTGAFRGGGPSYAVLGSGIDICYPSEHYGMYEKMKTNGGIISEYGLGKPALPGQFPVRNRIISGLADGILVIEAKERSGSLITADLGLDQGKDIFAVPGRIGDTLSYGCNRLIKMGAFLVQSVDDILEHYHFHNSSKSKDWKKNNYMLETKEKIVYANLSYNPKHINEIIVDTKLSLSEIMECLVSLELKGYIRQNMKNFYVLCSE